MHLRLSLWTAFFAFVMSAAVHAQGSAAASPAQPGAIVEPGQIVAKKIVGSVNVTVNGATKPLHENDPVLEHATVQTMPDSSVILVFSNGATTQLGADTILDIDQFVQDPFSATINIGALAQEPTRSKTKLRLTKGELVGHVAKLNHEQGSEYEIDTPVGAAGIRGTTFRLMFIPSGSGRAFARFALSTLEGHVQFAQHHGGGQPGAPGPIPPAPGQPEPGQPEQAPTPPSTPGPGPANGPGEGVAVSSGQEVTLTVSVNVNPQTNTIVVTAPPPPPVVQPMPETTRVQITTQANTVINTGSDVSFQAPAPSTGTSSNQPSTGSSDSQDDSKEKTDESKETTPSDSSGSGNGDAAGAPSDSNSSGANATPTTSTPSQTDAAAGNNSNANSSQNTGATQQTVSTPPPSPPVTTPAPVLTPGAGK